MSRQANLPAGMFMVAEAGVENNGVVAADSGPGAETPVPAGGTVSADAGREDLTVFFSIGVVVDVLLVSAFLVWAVRQWRKAGK